MTPTALILVTISAVLHAGWNLLGKRARPAPAFFLVAALVGAALLLPMLAWRIDILRAMPPAVWGCVALTGLFQATYFVGLAGAYRAGHMSVAYPLVRSLPVVLVAAASVAAGRGGQIGGAALVGMGLIVGGCMLLPMAHLKDLRLGNYLNASCAFALLAALGTTGYSMADDEALRMLRNALGEDAGPVAGVAVYYALESVAAACWLTLLVLSRRRERQELRLLIRGGLPAALTAGVAIMVTYGLVLVAMGYAANVSYVVAVRQLSVPVGAVLGVTVLGEPRPAPKVVGIAVMFAGLLMAALG